MDALVGHSPLKTVFERLIKNDSLSHAYLFTGPESVGKTAFIRVLSAQLLGTTSESLLSHPDLSWVTCPVDEKTGIQKTILPVDTVRDLRESFSMSAFSGGWRVAVIEDASAMTPAAANALLKILEEPPRKTIFFLRAASPEDLPRTIVSRTQVIRMKSVATEAIVSALVLRGASTKEAIELANVASGRPGIALRFLTDRTAYTDWKVRTETFERHLDLGVSERLAFAKNLLSKDESKDHTRGEEIFAAWEFVLRRALHATPVARATQGLDRLAESRTAFARHTPLQLAFEHTLLHI